MSQANSLRCTFCGINYPIHPQFEVCPIHEEETTPVPAKPDEDWKPRAEALYLAKIEDETRPPIPKTKGKLPLVEDAAKFLFVSNHDLIRAGIRFPTQGGSFHLFEHDGWIYETQAYIDSTRTWWVEKVAPALKIERPKKEAREDSPVAAGG